MNKIIETKDYTKFELHPFNRNPKHNTKKFRNLVASMKQYGWIDAYPMHVVENGNGKYKIKAGHNRFDAAQLLGIPVKYVICTDTASLTVFENSHNAWNMEDFMCGFTNQGNSNYSKVNAFKRKYGIPLQVTIALIRGYADTGGNLTAQFKAGDFRIGNPTHAENVGEMVLFCDELGIEFCRNSRFVLALSKVMLVDGIDHDELKKKIKNHIYLVKKQPDVVGYIRMLEEVYNRQRGNKLAIAIQATA